VAVWPTSHPCFPLFVFCFLSVSRAELQPPGNWFLADRVLHLGCAPERARADLLLSLVSKSVRVLSCTSVIYLFIYLFLLIVPAGFCGPERRLDASGGTCSFLISDLLGRLRSLSLFLSSSTRKRDRRPCRWEKGVGLGFLVLLERKKERERSRPSKSEMRKEHVPPLASKRRSGPQKPAGTMRRNK
jgi:hypothetical protein